MTKEEKKCVTIFFGTFIVSIALCVAGIWGLYALLAHFMGETLAICLIAVTYLVGFVSGLASIKKSDGTWLLNFWLFNMIRKISFWWLDVSTRIIQIIKKAGEPEIISEPAAEPSADAQ